MEEKLKEIIEQQELNVAKYVQEKDWLNAKMKFFEEHKFPHELDHLRIKKSAISEMLYDYSKAIEKLRELLNGWNS